MSQLTSGGQEVEIKLPVLSAEEALRQLNAAGFEVVKPRALETNIVYDTPSLDLRQTQRLLRVRELGGTDAKLTFKGPPLPAKHKIREEIETSLADAAVFGLILDRLGYQPVFRYEKFRTELEQPLGSGVATIDETPAGVYMELEGPPDWIDAIAHSLGFKEDAYVTDSYGRLWQLWRASHPDAPVDMVFPTARA
jgi:adenylate cyclase class 2